jgi:hypothetical protein
VNPIALRLSAISLELEGHGMPEIVEALQIAEREILRLQELRDKGIEHVWAGRRLYFKVMASPRNTTLACIFNGILDALGQSREEGTANWEKYYPGSHPQAEPPL